MKRCLHITIHESSNGAQRTGTAYPIVRPGYDPETRDVAPETDDPATRDVAPETDDPATRDVAPETDDPRSGPYRPGGPYGHPGITVHECGCAASPSLKPAAGSGDTSTPHPFIARTDYSGFVIVRMAEGVESDDNPAESLWHLAEEHQPKLAGLRKVLELAVDTAQAEPVLGDLSGAPVPPPGVLASRAFIEIQSLDMSCSPPQPTPLPRDESRARIRKLEKEAATTAFPPLHSLTSYWRLDLRKNPDLVEKVIADLNRLPEVDLAYQELAASDPQLSTLDAGRRFTEDQGYLDNAPVGIGASWAWESLNGQAATAPKVTLCDLEQGWNTNHRELETLMLSSQPFFGANRASDESHSGHHGTAVLGQLAAAGKSVKGAAAGLGQFVLASHYRSQKDADLPGTNGHVADAILQALASDPVIPGLPLGKGSILLLEVQRGLLPTEIDEADFDAIRLASAHGVLVVEAAGNGGFDLDAWTDPVTGRSLRRGSPGFRDSGAVLVGAARAAVPHDRAPFSNYGSRVDCFGWGEAVTTSGYGDLDGKDKTDFYTNAFSGTSSASPIVAGAAALVQAIHNARAGRWLEPRTMRALLSNPETGTPQGRNVTGRIGVMPNVEAIVRGLQLVPDVYMRRCVGDHGSKRGQGEEISSSPDIILWKGSPKQAAEQFGEGPGANDPAPGSPIDAGAPDKIYSSGSPKAHLYVRLRNRGVDTGTATVQLFASPAATLITPERWMPVQSIEVGNILQGDSLTVSKPMPVDLPQQWPQKASPEWPAGVVPPYSFLAVQLPSPEPHHAPGYERTVMLPPGPPYFDWDRYRSFLRGPGVTWRNVHAVQAGSGATLAFLLAGTPDRSRRFDFEVIQRLPAKVKVTLEVPEALAAKLRQRRPWLPDKKEDLELPHRPRTPLGGVALAPGSCVHAAFHVEADPGVSLKGHSLAIRQLWRGEEVGRITWWFVA